VSIIGIWMAIVGYGLAYSGMVSMGGGRCSLLDAFRGRCQGGAGRPQVGSAPPSGATLLSQAQANQQQQGSMIGTNPIPQVTV
jgi:hypothetical protein